MTYRNQSFVIIRLAFIFILIVSYAASSQTIKTDPDPVRFGVGCNYSIENLPPNTNIASYLWEHKITSPTTTTWGPVSSTNTTASQNVVEALPGTFTVRCTMTVQATEQNQNPDDIIVERSIVVPKPDNYILSGVGVSKALGTDCPIDFQVTQGGNVVSYIDGFAQEKIRNLTLYNQRLYRRLETLRYRRSNSASS